MNVDEGSFKDDEEEKDEFSEYIFFYGFVVFLFFGFGPYANFVFWFGSL